MRESERERNQQPPLKKPVKPVCLVKGSKESAMHGTYFEEALEATGSELRSPLDQSLSAGRCTCFPKLRRRLIYTVRGAGGREGLHGCVCMCVFVRACEEKARINRPVASDSADDGDITNAVNLASPLNRTDDICGPDKCCQMQNVAHLHSSDLGFL